MTGHTSRHTSAETGDESELAVIREVGRRVRHMKLLGASEWEGTCPSCAAPDSFRIVLVGRRRHLRAHCRACGWSALQ